MRGIQVGAIPPGADVQRGRHGGMGGESTFTGIMCCLGSNTAAVVGYAAYNMPCSGFNADTFVHMHFPSKFHLNLFLS